MSRHPIPLDLSAQVDQFVYTELADAEKYDNRTPLDESGTWSLHELVANAYARGCSDGADVAEERARQRHQRRDMREESGRD